MWHDLHPGPLTKEQICAETEVKDKGFCYMKPSQKIEVCRRSSLCYCYSYVGFEAFTAVAMKNAVF
jgi:hypothetical protein